jgi:vitamin-K-epoxide reductase (warfarin-sensitive)
MQPAVNQFPSARILFLLIAILSAAGIIDSAVALQRHLAKSATTYCDFSQKINCDIVNRSEYSTLVGIPVALIGVGGYAAILALSTFLRSRVETPSQLLGTAIAGLAFALYLTYIEAYVLMTWCILCVISLLLIVLISLSAVILKVKSATT